MIDRQITGRLLIVCLLYQSPEGLTGDVIAARASLLPDDCKAALTLLLRADVVTVEPPVSPDGECLWYLTWPGESVLSVAKRSIASSDKQYGGAA